MDKITNSLQENVLTLLCFDTEACPIVVGLIEPNLFDDHVYRRIAERAITYFEKYRCAPKNHLPDLLEAELNSSNKREAKIYRTAIRNIKDLATDGYRADFVLNTLRKFVREQRLKIGITESARILQEGNADRAEDILYEMIKQRDVAFDPGINLTEFDKLYSKLTEPDAVFKTGIKALDEFGIGPARKELFLYLAPTNRGKTWGLVNLGKHALLLRKKVLHITLEMSQEKISERYMQSLFSVARKPTLETGYSLANVPKLRTRKGEFRGIVTNQVERPALHHKVGRDFVRNKLIDQKLGSRYKLIVKEFPTGYLSIRELNSFLDMLERYMQFVPDIMIIDYADLMDISSKDLRVDTGRVYKQLRGIGVERDIAVASASQTNRLAEDVKWVTLKHMGEDYSKAATADNVVTYNQTALEKKLGLCRLFVAKGRNERSGDNIILSQAYGLGQFNIDSAPLNDLYFEKIEKLKR